MIVGDIMASFTRYRHGGFVLRITEGEKIADINNLNVGMPVGRCPKCGEKLIVRRGEHGKFIGCDGFKDGCRNTYNFDNFRAIRDFEILATKNRGGFGYLYGLLGFDNSDDS